MMDMDNHRHTLPVATPRCAALRSLLPLLSSGMLAPAEAEGVREHVATCAWCQNKLASFAVVEDALRRHYGAAGRAPYAPTALLDDPEPEITLDDVMRTAAAEAHPHRDLSPLEARRLTRRPHLPAFGALAATLVIALLAALILGQVASRGTGTHHPTPVPSPRPGTRPVLPVTAFYLSSDASVTPGDLVAGPDGDLWVACAGAVPPIGGWICRVTPSGDISTFPISHPHVSVTVIIVGPDRNLWFIDSTKIGRITSQGAISEFGLPDPGISVTDLAAGPDGNLWFTATSANGAGLIGRMTLRGVVTTFAMATPYVTPQGITAGPDGALWFTESDFAGNGKIGRLTTHGVIAEFAVPTPASAPVGITTGPDGNLWFTEISGNKIGRITPQGAITEFAVPTPSSRPRGIVMGPDHALWFAEDRTIARITLQGAITEFLLPSIGSTSANGGITDLAFAPDGHLWFTTLDTAQLVRVDAVP